MINLTNIDTVGIDFFDTIVHRKVNPENIISFWAKDIVLKYGIPLSSSYIYTLRKKEEVIIRKRIKKDPKYEEIISSVYDNIAQYIEGVEKSAFIKESLSRELEIELENIYLDKDQVEQIISLYKKVRIVIISDFYHRESFLRSICIKNEIDYLFDRIYVSCEIGKRKSDGSLYDYVLSDLKIKPSQMIMIGDNTISDQEIPKSLGINIFPKDRVELPIFYRSRRQIKKSIIMYSQDRGVLTGYSTIFYLFISRLYEKVITAGVKTLLFCSREGQFLKKIFDMYLEENERKEEIVTKYIYISRRSTFLASLKDIEHEDFARLFLNYPRCNVIDFLDSLSFTMSEREELMSSHSINKEAYAYPKGQDIAFDQFLESKEFQTLYESKRAYARDLLKSYIEQENGDGPIFMVDIGWRGSIQDNLYRALGGEKRIQGYYFGLKDSKKTDDNNKTGLIFDNNIDSSNYRLMSFNYIDLETICAANHGPVEGYVRAEDSIIPVINNDDSELAIYNYVCSEQEQLFDSIKKIVITINRSPYMYKDFITLLKSRYIHELCCYRSKYFSFYYGYRKYNKENFGLKTTKYHNNLFKRGYDEQIRWGMVNYAYRILDKIRLSRIKILAHLHCLIVSKIKHLELIFHEHN